MLNKTNIIRLFCTGVAVALALCLVAEADAQTQDISGSVTSGGTGLENVMVTDGVNTTLTDKNGHYNLQVAPNSAFVFVSTPAGYLPSDSLNVQGFYKAVEVLENNTCNFELIKNKKDDHRHEVLVRADAQFFKEEQFARYKTVIDDCIATIGEYSDHDVFGIDCGDLTADRPHFYSPYIDILNTTGVPFYRVLGNHDMKNGGRTKEKSVQVFEKYFGPTTYSFNRGKAHYIVINNVFYLGRPYAYMGYIDEQTYRWIEQDLAYVPKGSPVFVAMHIPARLNDQEKPFAYNQEMLRQQTVNIDALLEMLKPYKAHIFSGHEHYNKNIIHSASVYEHNTAAISGAFWQGDYCWDGTPIGYGVYEVNGTDVKWYFKSAGHSRKYQMRATPVGSSSEYPEDVIVNVWNWDENWTIEWKENGVEQGAMTRFTGLDPATTKAFTNKEALEFKWLGPVPTGHLFRASPKNKNSKIEIIVRDPFGETYTANL